MKPPWSLLFVGSKRVLLKLPAISSPAVSPASGAASDVYRPPSYTVSRKLLLRSSSTPPCSAWSPTCTTAVPL